MGKNYIESSLKRFLKRKVKITLGVVVSFLITGMVSFAGDKPVEEMNDFEKAEHYLSGLNNENNKLEKLMAGFQDVSNGKEGIKLDTANNKIILEKFKNNGTEDIEITLKNENISDVTAQNIKTALENGANSINKIDNNTLENSINNGNIIITKPGTIAISGSSINNGIISSPFGQSGAGGKIGINNGIIYFTKNGQYISSSKDKKESFLINNGIIISDNFSRKAQIVETSGTQGILINNGIIINGGQCLEAGKNNKTYNYGVMKNGQQLIKTSFSSSYNYGIIYLNHVDNVQEIQTSAENSKIKNYGLLKISTDNKTGQKILGGTENTAENYGVIEIGAKGTAISVTGDTNKGFNYGTVFVKDVKQNSVKIFDGNVINKGLVILDNFTGDLKNITLGNQNNGLVFKKENKNYSLVNTDTVVEIKDGISDSNFAGKTTAYVTGTGNKIENLSDKVIGTVVKDDISEKGAVITADKDLTFENTVITGYFENKGTLLDMGKHNLSLLGDTKLVASKDNFNLKEKEIYALNIDGTLKMLGNAEVAGKITGTGKIQEVAVNGENGKHASAIELDTVLLQNATEQEEKYLETVDDNFTEVSYSDLTTNQVVLDFDRTAKDKENTITFTDNLLIKGNKNGVAIDGTSTETGNNINLNFSSLDSEKVKGDILLGASNDDIVVERNGKYNSTIDMGAGNDSFTVNGFAQSTIKADNHKELGTFNYKLAGVETITLKGNGEKNQGWHIGEHASLSDVNGATLKVENTELHVDMNNNYGKGDVTTSLDKLAGEKGANNLTISTSKDDTGKDTGVVKFVVGDKFNVSDKQFEVAHDYSVKGANLGTAVIFKGTGTDGAVEEKNGKIALTVKEASEITSTEGENKGVNLANYKAIYDTMLGALSSNEDLRAAVNYSDANNLVDMVVKTNNTASAFYTTGYAVTKDVTDTYMSIVDDFGRKAGAGEWIAYGKYVNSDTEFDGGKASKGYDGDITGTVGMIEYGVNDTTSYGAVFGKGDTKVDINGGGKLDGDNTYAGLYMKHKTQTGIDLTANVGYTKSDLDLNLATSASNYNMITDGSSDSTALTFALKGTKDYKLSESMRLQPVVSARYSLINQDAVESKDANFRIDEQDVTIFEGAFGGNVIKDFDVYNGTLSLKAGAEFVLTEVSKSDDGRYTLYGKDITLIDEEDIADNKIRTHVGAEYIHENGVGIDAKYEMIFTDKGDTDRITAGVSYKF